MARRIGNLIAVLFTLGVALPGWAGDSCVSDTSFNWTGVTAGDWTCTGGGGTPTNDDDFRISTGHVVTVNGTLTIVTGSVGMESALSACGTLIVPAGITLTYGDGTGAAPDKVGGLVMDCGTLVTQGQVRTVGRVTNVTESDADTAAGAGTVTIATDTSLAGIATTDMLVFTDEDPANAASPLNGQSVWVGPGVAPTGVHRPAYNKWAWYNITAVSGQSLTYQLSSEETFSGSPYRGTRDWPTGTADPLTMSDNAEVVTAVRQWNGYSTAIRVASGYAEMCKNNADLGSFYAMFEEPAHDATGLPESYCGGQGFKVLHCERGAPNFDFLDADVSVANDTITEAGHTYAPGDLVRLTTTGVLPAGLALTTDYYAVVSDANTILVATTVALAAAGQQSIDNGGACGASCVDITAAAGGGTHTSNGRVASLAANTEDDIVWVAGDASVCSNGDFHLTHGVRRGDPFEVVTPAILNGDTNADGNPEGAIVILGGTVKIDRTSIRNVGFNSVTDITPAVGVEYNVLFAQGGSTGATTVADGYLQRSEIWHNESSTTDTGTLAFMGSTTVAMRFPADGSPDFSGLTVDRLHIHDAYNEGTLAGTHGYLDNSTRNVNPTRLRIERQSDDGAAGIAFDPTITCTATDGRCTLSTTLRQFLVYENIADGDNSQEGLSFGTNDNGANDALSTTAITAGWLKVYDFIAIGHYEASLNTNGGGILVDRSVFSGNFLGAATRLNLSSSGLEFSATGAMHLNENTIRNSVLSAMGNSGTPNEMSVLGEVYNSHVFGRSQYKSLTVGSIFYGNRYEGVMIDFDALGSEILLRAAVTNPVTPPSLTIGNSVFRVNGGSATTLCLDYGNSQVFSLSRFFMAIGAYQIGGSPDGPLRLCATTTSSTLAVDGLTVTTTAASGNGLLQWNATGSSVENVCFESAFDNVPAVEAFTTACDTCLNSSGLTPEADDDPGLRGFLADTSTESVCGNYARPESLGFVEFGVAHAMLGDGVIKDYRDWTSEDLIRPTSAGDGGGGGASGGPSHW